MTAEPSGKPKERGAEETPLEAVASICSILVVGLFVLTLVARNFMIPSGSMEKTLLIGDHLVVDEITFAPPARWMPLIHARDPRSGDIVVFFKPVANSEGEYAPLVKRCIGVPGDRIHLHDGIVYVNGVAQGQPPEGQAGASFDTFLDEFPSQPPPGPYGPDGTPETWAVDFPSHVQDGEIVVPAGMYFMMGDNRHNSLDSRYWGFVPRENIVGRPLFNYWSFTATEEQLKQTGLGARIAWMGHVALRFFPDTRWSRTFKRMR